MKTLNEDVIFRDMMNTMRDIKYNRRMVEEYQGDYEKQENGEDEPVTEDTYPGVLGELTDPLIQKIPNVQLDKDALKVNKKKSTITLTGKIPNLSNLSFVITTDISDSFPLYLSVESLNLTEDGLQTMTALFGYAKVVYTEWSVNKVKETFK